MHFHPWRTLLKTSQKEKKQLCITMEMGSRDKDSPFPSPLPGTRPQGRPWWALENIFLPNARTNPGQPRDHVIWLHTNSALVFNSFFFL